MGTTSRWADSKDASSARENKRKSSFQVPNSELASAPSESKEDAAGKKGKKKKGLKSRTWRDPVYHHGGPSGPYVGHSPYNGGGIGTGPYPPHHGGPYGGPYGPGWGKPHYPGQVRNNFLKFGKVSML